MAVADPIVALKAILEADGHEVYGSELPEDQWDQMPKDVIVLAGGGGSRTVGGGQNDWLDTRVDVRCWGQSPTSAWQLHLVVQEKLLMLMRDTTASVLVHWLRTAGGPTSDRDPDTRWPFTLTSWQVMYHIREV